jgi:hypothetical protein
VKTDVGSYQLQWIYPCPLSQLQGRRFLIVTTIQIVGDETMDYGLWIMDKHLVDIGFTHLLIALVSFSLQSINNVQGPHVTHTGMDSERSVINCHGE